MEALFFLVIRIAIAYGIGSLGKRYKIGFGWAFAFSIFSPIIAIIIVLCSGKKSTTFIDIKKEDNENNG